MLQSSSLAQGPRAPGRWVLWADRPVAAEESDPSPLGALCSAQTHLCFPVVATEPPVEPSGLVHPSSSTGEGNGELLVGALQ